MIGAETIPRNGRYQNAARIGAAPAGGHSGEIEVSDVPDVPGSLVLVHGRVRQ